jgi:diguanylate cyclase (GGDEF)-like protein/PAS domain S-box-containing protein
MSHGELNAQSTACPVLNESVCRYLTLFEYGPVAIAVIDPQTNRYIEVNQRLCDRLRYTREQILASTVGEINPRFRQAALEQLARQVAENKIVQFCGNQTASSGEEVDVLVTVTPIYRDSAILLHCATVDLTAQFKAERQVVESEKRFRETFEQAAVGISHVAMDGAWIRLNQRFCDILGYSSEELRGLHVPDITHPDDIAADEAQAEELLRRKMETSSLEKRYFRKDGSVIWVNRTVSVARNEIGEPEYFISVIEDISARKKAEAERDVLIHTLEEKVRRRTEQLELLTRTDALTGIANRRCFDEHLAAEWARGLRSGQPLSIIVIDVDYFKSLNDRLGHACGDRCVTVLARVLGELSTRSTDLVARLGGDEFVFLLPETDRSGAEGLARKVQAAVHELSVANPGAPNAQALTVSQGSATAVPSRSSTPEQLLEEADRAMYVAKRRGRDQIFVTARL